MKANEDPKPVNPESNLADIRRGINELISMEKRFRDDMKEFVQLLEDCMSTLTPDKQAELRAFLEPYKTLSSSGFFMGLQEVDEKSSLSEVMAAVGKISSGLKSGNPKYRAALNNAASKQAVFQQFLIGLTKDKGNILSRLTGNKFMQALTKNHESNTNHKFNRKDDLKKFFSQLFNSTLMKPIQVIMRYANPLVDIDKKMNKEGFKESFNAADSKIIVEGIRLVNEAKQSAIGLATASNEAFAGESTHNEAGVEDVSAGSESNESEAHESEKAEVKSDHESERKSEDKPEQKTEDNSKQKTEYKSEETAVYESIVAKLKEKKASELEKIVKASSVEDKSERSQENRKHHHSHHLKVGLFDKSQTSNKKPAESSNKKPADKSAVELVKDIINQKFPHSKHQVIRKIRELIAKGGNGAIDKIKLLASTELKSLKRVGYSSSNYDPELKRILNIFASGNKENLVREVVAAAAKDAQKRTRTV